MSEQLHAPPTEEEYKDCDTWKRAASVDEILAWGKDDGWCSACKHQDIRVAHMGTDERNFALCGYCLSRLFDALRGSQVRTEPHGGSR